MKRKKIPVAGYENESISVHKTINATDFIQSSDYLGLLASAYKVSLSLFFGSKLLKMTLPLCLKSLE